MKQSAGLQAYLMVVYHLLASNEFKRLIMQD